MLGAMLRALAVAVAAVALAVGVGTAGRAADGAACAPVPAYRVVSGLPHYRLDVSVSRDGAVAGSERLTFRLPRATDRVVLRLWANAPLTREAGARLDARVTTMPTGARVVRSADPTMLVVRLASRLPRRHVVVLAVRFTVKLPIGIGPYRLARSNGYVRLGSFFPLLALDRDGRWATDPPSFMAAETWVSPSAEFDVTLHTPRDWNVVATGVPDGDGRWHADSVRDFAAVAGVLTRTGVIAHAPKPVLVTAVAPGSNLASIFAHRAATALERLAKIYGPYPWPRFNVAVFHDLGRTGIEYPNLVFEGSAGLERVTAHETAHQWFYSLVGNNQARDPWLDESLASWAMTRVDPVTRGIAKVPIPERVHGHLDEPMTYWDQDADNYFAGVYAQGYQAFASLGDPQRTDCALRLYVARNAFGIARPADLDAALAARLPADALKRFAAFR
jgi:Peptidase family M1 domain